MSVDTLLSGVVKAVREQVGASLSTLEGTTLPSVIQDIQNGVRPDFPYIVVSLEDDADSNGAWLRSKYVDDTDNVHIVSEDTSMVRIVCYGDGSTDILRNLRTLSLDDELRISMNTLTGSNFQGYTRVQRRPEYISTDFINAAFMLAEFTTVSDLVSPTGGIIENVTGEASYLNAEGDENPIRVPIDTTSS